VSLRRNFAFVEFEELADATLAKAKLNGYYFEGKDIIVRYAASPDDKVREDELNARQNRRREAIAARNANAVKNPTGGGGGGDADRSVMYTNGRGGGGGGGSHRERRHMAYGGDKHAIESNVVSAARNDSSRKRKRSSRSRERSASPIANRRRTPSPHYQAKRSPTPSRSRSRSRSRR